VSVVAVAACNSSRAPWETRAGAAIIHGTAATDYPEAALVDLSQGGTTVAACSGSIIAPRVVLTAGHCVDGFDGFTVKAPYAGAQTAIGIRGATLDYRSTADDSVPPNVHDVGVVFLDRDITLDHYPTLAEESLADDAMVVDIGRIQDGVLSNDDLYASPPHAVRSAYPDGYPFDYIAVDAIQPGDSGGPVVTPGTHTIVALSSGANPDIEVVARVDLVVDWLKQQIAASSCGNGVKDGSEACDGDDFGTFTCASAVGYAAAGQLKCTPQCTLDFSACGSCGDGHRNVNEPCDGTDFGFGGATCASATGDVSSTGTVACTSSCTFDTSACNVCGDGKRRDGEACDGADLGGQTCGTVFAPGATGTLSCNASCGFDTSACVAAPSCGDVSGLQPGSPWPMRGGCPARQGRSPEATLVAPASPWATLTEKWATSIGGLVAPTGGSYFAASSPAIAADGTIYVGSGDKKLYAISASGAVAWTFATNGAVLSSPAIGRDGTIYFGSGDGHLYAVTASGARAWAFAVPNAGNYMAAIDSSPAIGKDGTIYFESNGYAYALAPDGTKRWSTMLEWGAGVTEGSPAIGIDGTLYFSDNVFTALHPDGTLAWNGPYAGTSTWGSPSVASDGTIYDVLASYYAAKLLAIDPSGGSTRWSAAISTWYDELLPSPAIGADGIVAAGGNVIDASGHSLLQATTIAYASPTFSSNGWLLVPGDTLTLLRNAGSFVDSGPKISAPTVYSSPAIGMGGIVYIVGSDAKLHAFGP
jgi:outer membrane protein assembly factor BamB